MPEKEFRIKFATENWKLETCGMVCMNLIFPFQDLLTFLHILQKKSSNRRLIEVIKEVVWASAGDKSLDIWNRYAYKDRMILHIYIYIYI